MLGKSTFCQTDHDDTAANVVSVVKKILKNREARICVVRAYAEDMFRHIPEDRVFPFSCLTDASQIEMTLTYTSFLESRISELCFGFNFLSPEMYHKNIEVSRSSCIIF